MSGGYARASGAGAGSAGNAIEFEDPIDDARVQVAGLKRKHERLSRAHSELVSRVGADAARGADRVLGLELARSNATGRLVEVRRELADAQQTVVDAQRRVADVTEDVAVTASCVIVTRDRQRALVSDGDERVMESSDCVGDALGEAEAAEATLVDLETAAATEAAQAPAVSPAHVAVECCVCYTEIAVHVGERWEVLPCGHNEFCWTCVKDLKAKHFDKCPMCRGQVTWFQQMSNV